MPPGFCIHGFGPNSDSAVGAAVDFCAGSGTDGTGGLEREVKSARKSAAASVALPDVVPPVDTDGVLEPVPPMVREPASSLLRTVEGAMRGVCVGILIEGMT